MKNPSKPTREPAAPQQGRDIERTCPHCFARQSVPAVGGKIACTSCGKSFDIKA